MRKEKIRSIFFALGYIAVFFLMQYAIVLLFSIALIFVRGSVGPSTAELYLLAAVADAISAAILLLTLRLRRIPLRDYADFGPTKPMPTAMALAGGFALSGIAGIFVSLLDSSGAFQTLMQNYKDQFASLDIRANLPLYAATIWLLVPVCEEIVFRGFLQNELKRVFKDWQAILIGAAAFGVIHLNPVQIAYTFAIGLFFGYAFDKTKKLMVPILMHILFNIMGTSLEYISDERAVTIITLAGIPLFAITLIYFMRYRRDETRPGS